MPVDRPTFSESWYRVAQLRPRLRSTVQVHRQHFRGRMWHVLQDPSSNQFFRLNDPLYRFVAALDGRRTVAEVWQICNEESGDSAPTQGEAIQFLGQLYSSNLLQAELPPDAEGLFRRYSKRVRREVQGYLMNLLFIRIPLLDPDHFLNRWVGIFGRIFTWPILIAWLVLVTVGLSIAVGNFDELANQTAAMFSADNLARNLPLLYLTFVFIKVFHEFGHAFACKKFGKDGGTGGEVHVMGIMFLVFTPLPYVDASSAWAFRKKLHRVLVGGAGILIELAIAAVATIVWAKTAEVSESAIVHDIAYKVMFLASVGTILFNGNPLLRFDGYYILSDLIEIPNLAQRSKDYLYYIVKRYVWGVRRARSPAHTGGEGIWLFFYAIASTVFRVFISVRILLFVADKFFVLGAMLAITAVVTWVCVPLGKFVRYLMTNGELTRVRPRAVGTTLLTLTALVVGVGLIPATDRCLVEGVVEPLRVAIIHAAADGFVEEFLPSGTEVSPDGPPLVSAVNPELVAQRKQLLAERRRLVARRRLAQTQEVASAQILADQIAAVEQQIQRVNEQLESLKLSAPLVGKWIAPEIERLKGAYLRRGDKIGIVASLDEQIIRVIAGQRIAALIIEHVTGHQGDRHVRIRIRSDLDPELEFSGTVKRILPAGDDQLPSAALGYAAGGATQVDPRTGKTVERFFEIRVVPQADAKANLLSGQRVIVRFEMTPKPLMVQWWRSILQVVQRRFRI